MYQALYRKWRPRTFDDVVGQSHITDTLKRQVATGRLSHAYLFTGTRGTGKTTCAKILARAVNCEHPVDGNPCNECDACRGIENGSILDVLELDAASNNGVDQVRALLPPDEELYDLAELFKIFGDSTRIKILYALLEGELCVCDIAKLMEVTQSAVSHQLRVLKSSKLVKFRRDGKTLYYSLADEHVCRIISQGMEHVEE